MKKIKIIIAGFAFAILATNQTYATTKENIEEIKKKLEHLEKRAKQLEKSYKKISCVQGKKSKKLQEMYFQAFPKNFFELNGLFGYKSLGLDEEEKKYPKSLKQKMYFYNCSYGEKYLDTFFNLDAIKQDKFFNRLIDIGSEGSYQADLITIYAHGQNKKIKKNLKNFCKVLSKRSDKVIEGFWFFYFDGYHPPKKIPEDLQKVKNINPRIYQLMEKALKETHKGACCGG